MSLTKRIIKIVEVTGFNPAQIETEFNTNWGPKGWRIVRIFEVGTKVFILAEKELD